MSGAKVFEFVLPIDSSTFLTVFWQDKNHSYYLSFLQNQLKNLDISISDWADGARKVRSMHPSKVSFPGMPSHAESLKVHTILPQDAEGMTMVREENSFKGIPYSDYFTVKTEWVVMNVEEGMSPSINVKIFLDIAFHKYTWLEGTIFSNTKSELIDVYGLWHATALEHLASNGLLLPKPSFPLTTVANHHPIQHDDDAIGYHTIEDEEMFYDCEDLHEIGLDSDDLEAGGRSHALSLAGGGSRRRRPSLTSEFDEHNNNNSQLRSSVAQCVESAFVLLEYILRQVHVLFF